MVEPIQGRGGIRIPPRGFLRELREQCDANDWLLIADEVFTGFGRTGRWFACEHEQVVPDLLCVGKGLASGMPISACIGRESVMEAWPLSDGEALHTQTFLGHPAGCAAALASLSVLEEEKLVEASRDDGEFALQRLREGLGSRPDVLEIRGRGLMLGVELRSHELALAICNEALGRGVILLPAGDDGRVLSITPPLSIGREMLAHALDIVMKCLP